MGWLDLTTLKLGDSTILLSKSSHWAPKFLLLVIGYGKGHVWVTSKIQTCTFKLKLVIINLSNLSQ